MYQPLKVWFTTLRVPEEHSRTGPTWTINNGGTRISGTTKQICGLEITFNTSEVFQERLVPTKKQWYLRMGKRSPVRPCKTLVPLV